MVNSIVRHETSARMSRIVLHHGTAYLAGVVATNRDADALAQTQDVLALIDQHLASVGSDKSRILTAQIWLKNIERDFQAMNLAWEAWMPLGAAPARATCEARLAAPELLIEIIVTAAV
ncbi:MAG: RidA family protein [Burkholderiaceae bacterium]